MDGVEVAGVGLEEGIADGGFWVSWEEIFAGVAGIAEEDSTGEGVPVGVEAVAGEADEPIAGNDGRFGELFGFVDDSGYSADDVDFSIGVDAGHFGGFAAYEGASDVGTGLGGSGDDLVKD